MIRLFKKLSQRLSDPVFYRKRRVLRQARRNPRAPRPIELEDLPPGPVLVAIAHPDDESFCSGLLCELATSRPITVFCTTRGEGGGTSNLVDEDDLANTRKMELHQSCRHLGITDIHSGYYVDPNAKEFKTYAPEVPDGELERHLRKLYTEIGASFMITHGSGGEYWHPAHLQLFDAATYAGLPMLTMNAWNRHHKLPRLLNRPDPADLTFDGSSHRKKRLAALNAHCTQVEYFREVADSRQRFIDATAIESYCNRLDR